ncbi:hypothetical protein ACHAWU_007115 [Discostella pseudostelligera]|uniref:Uncharacterized protein n=1 Tax=Discostella pseudostelligera TaxID=259834 RepID=A0ABD3M094_9STRA
MCATLRRSLTNLRLLISPSPLNSIQDPEMMREAQKMMADPAFQERMKQYTENEAFKASMAKTQEMLKDEKKVKELEETMKKRVEEGTKELEALRKEVAEAEEGEKQRAEELKPKNKTMKKKTSSKKKKGKK